MAGGLNKQDSLDHMRGRGWMPAVGFVLMVAWAVVAWFTSDLVRDGVERFINRTFTSGALADLSGDELRIIIAVVIWMVLLLLSFLIFAAAMPRSKGQVKDMDMAKERKEVNEIKDFKKRQRRKLKREMRNL